MASMPVMLSQRTTRLAFVQIVSFFIDALVIGAPMGSGRTFRITFVISDTGKLYVLPIVGRTVIAAPLAAT